MPAAHPRTVRRIKAENLPTIAQARREVCERIADALAHRTEQTVERPSSIATTGTGRDAVGAARMLLSEARAWRDSAYVTERLETIEDELAQRRQTR